MAGLDAPLFELPADDGFLARRVCNSKGMLAWDMLGRMIGYGRLSAFLRGIVVRAGFQRLPFEDFVNALRSELGSEAWFIDQWFLRSGAPEFRMRWRYENAVLAVTLEQEEPHYIARLPVVARGANGDMEIFEVEAGGARVERSFPLVFEPVNVDLDPEMMVLRWTPELRAEAERMLSYVRADLLLNRGENAAAALAFQTALEADLAPDLRALLLRGMGDAAAFDDRPADAIPHYRAVLEIPLTQVWTPEIWRSLADSLAATGDEGGYRAAMSNANAAVEALRSIPATQ